MRTRLFPLASTVIVIVALATVLSACGQKGPLYLPQDPAAPAATATTGAHSHGQPAGKRKEEAKDPSQPHAEQPSEQQPEQHTEAEAVTK